MSGFPHERIFPARRAALPQVEAFLAEVCAAAQLDRAMCLRVTLLVEELVTLAHARKIRVLSGRFVEQGAFAHQGFCELVQDYFRARDTGGSSASARPDFTDLAADLVALFPVLGEISELRAAAGLSVGDGAPLRSSAGLSGRDAQAQRRETLMIDGLECHWRKSNWIESRHTIVRDAFRMRQGIEHGQLHRRHAHLRDDAAIDELDE